MFPRSSLLFSRPVNQTQAQQQERSDQNPPTATSQGRRKETTSHTQRIKRRGLEQKSKKGARGRCARGRCARGRRTLSGASRDAFGPLTSGDGNVMRFHRNHARPRVNDQLASTLSPPASSAAPRSCSSFLQHFFHLILVSELRESTRTTRTFTDAHKTCVLATAPQNGPCCLNNVIQLELHIQERNTRETEKRASIILMCYEWGGVCPSLCPVNRCCKRRTTVCPPTMWLGNTREKHTDLFYLNQGAAPLQL